MLGAGLTKDAANAYGGMWLDQDDGGTLVVAMTDPRAAAGYLRSMHDLARVCSSGVNYQDSYDAGAGADYLPGTRCGRVTSTDVGINTDICARDGDSGGPLFSELDSAAYGILEGNTGLKGPCVAGELNNNTPISTIMDDINNRRPTSINGGSIFSVIT
ncbi:MAG TPA: hypothetical protein VF069_11690 [Streptosporangiaceae bacterium]